MDAIYAYRIVLAKGAVKETENSSSLFSEIVLVSITKQEQGESGVI